MIKTRFEDGLEVHAVDKNVDSYTISLSDGTAFLVDKKEFIFVPECGDSLSLVETTGGHIILVYVNGKPCKVISEDFFKNTKRLHGND